LRRYSEYMRPVAVVGIGKTKFGAFAEEGIRSMGVTAVTAALADAGIPTGAVEAFYLGNFAGPSFTGQSHLAPYVAGACGLAGIPATRFEAACASSGVAFHQAWQAVANGVYDVVVVCGVEKMTSQSTARVGEILAMAGDVAVDRATFPELFARIARAHMERYGTTREQMAAVAVKNHRYGFENPYAHLRKLITMEQALAGKVIADPLTIYDCSLVSDGAAAVVLAAEGRYRVLGMAQTSDEVALTGRADLTTLPAVGRSAARAYAMAGVTADDIEFAEVHDCFTIAEIVAMEELGFCAKGEGGAYAASEARPINRSGGLKSKGHPVGATGVAQIVDVVGQMRAGLGSLGLAQNLGGSGATSVVTVLGKV
jgi:acetyl-CoA C-acetyltransferase